jgi:hypothetical protein
LIVFVAAELSCVHLAYNSDLSALVAADKLGVHNSRSAWVAAAMGRVADSADSYIGLALPVEDKRLAALAKMVAAVAHRDC